MWSVKSLLGCVGIIERSQGIIWAFMFHSGISVFSSSDINQIVSVFCNAAFAPRPWKNITFINCTFYLSPRSQVFKFSVFNTECIEASLPGVRKWKTGWLMVSEQNTPHLPQNKAEHCFKWQQALPGNLICGAQIFTYHWMRCVSPFSLLFFVFPVLL